MENKLFEMPLHDTREHKNHSTPSLQPSAAASGDRIREFDLISVEQRAKNIDGLDELHTFFSPLDKHTPSMSVLLHSISARVFL